MSRFLSAMKALDDAQLAGKPVQVGRAREKALCEALVAMAEELGADIAPSLINTLGEIDINAKPDTESQRLHGACGRYGEAFASWLNTIPVRSGTVFSTGHVMAAGGWKKANHFDVERLVRSYAAHISQDAVATKH